MKQDKLQKYITKTQAYLASPEGRLNSKGYSVILGWSQDRILAEAVMFCCRLVKYEHICQVTEALGKEEVWL